MNIEQIRGTHLIIMSSGGDMLCSSRAYCNCRQLVGKLIRYAPPPWLLASQVAIEGL